MATNSPEYMRNWRAANKEHLRQYEKDRYVGERRQRSLVNAAQKRRDDPEGIRTYSQKYYQENKEAFIEYSRIWRKNNLERYRLAKRNRQARRRAKISDPSQVTLAYIEILLADPCGYCGRPTEHIDHIDPISKDGVHSWENLTAACASCNCAKHDKSLLRFLLR